MGFRALTVNLSPRRTTLPPVVAREVLPWRSRQTPSPPALPPNHSPNPPPPPPQPPPPPARPAPLHAASPSPQPQGPAPSPPRLLPPSLPHAAPGLKLAQLARLVGVSRPPAPRQQGMSSKEAVQQAHHRLDGRP